MTALPVITAAELQQKLERADDFVLIDALAPMVYAHSHLPGAINMPPNAVEPIRCSKRMPDRRTQIVVYCSNHNCEDSVVTGTRLAELGYTDVRHYAGGKDEWKRLGLPLERAGKPFSGR